MTILTQRQNMALRLALYAAAPDLLESCKKAHKWAMLKNDMDTVNWLEEMESAIAKAEGRTK